MVRAAISVEPPGAKGTISRIGLVGYVWLNAAPAALTNTAANNPIVIKRSMDFIKLSPFLIDDRNFESTENPLKA
jgi:hypothetical protein